MKKFFLSMVYLLFACVYAHADEYVFKYGTSIDEGWGDATTYTPYISLPKDVLAPYAGAQITKVRIGLCQAAKNVYVYVKNNPKDDAPLCKKKVGTMEKGWNEITLDEPVLIEAGVNLALGYKATFDVGGGVGYSRETFPDANFIYQNANTSWSSVTGSISIEAVLEGDNLPQNELRLSSVNDFKAPMASDVVTVTSKVRNGGTKTVTSFTIDYGVDNQEREVKTIECNMASNDYAEFSFDVPTIGPGVHTIYCSVVSVNGVEDEYTLNNAFEAKMTVLDPTFARVAVCEEGTGLWCGWCPRGMVGMALMKELHPNNFLGVSIHGSDVLEIPSQYAHSFSQILSKMEGFPTCFMSRRTKGDPYQNIAHMYNTTMSTESPMKITGTAEWNADSTAIKISSEVIPNGSLTDESLYNIAYILVEDGVTGYVQTNYYGNNQNGYMYGWEKKGEKTSDVVFNELARGIFPCCDGEPLQTGVLNEGDKASVEYNLVLPEYPGAKVDYDVKDKKNVRVVGIVINNTSGYIETAFEASPNSDVNRVEDICIDNAEVIIYDASGRRVTSATQPGLYIVKQGKRINKTIIK